MGKATGTRATLQTRVGQWVVRALGAQHLADRQMRAKRLLEEAIELAQAEGLHPDLVHAWVEHVYGRPAGGAREEARGVGITYFAYCESLGEDHKKLIEEELARVSTPAMIAKVRERQAAKEAVGRPVLGHKTRFSDSSVYDEVCTLCGATDARGDDRLDKPCPNAAIFPSPHDR
jgi:hypothetical protein